MKTMKGLSKSTIKSFVLGLPPLSEQKRIVKIINLLLNACDEMEQKLHKAKKTAELFAQAAVAAITGTQIKEQEKMKVPKTELVSKLRIAASPANKEQSPLSAILLKHKGELSAKALWNYSGLEINRFYQQLKIEMAKGWIVEPEKAFMKEKEVGDN